MKLRLVALVIILGGLLLGTSHCPALYPDPIPPGPDPDPNPTPGVTLFFDDFQNGLSPDWDVTPGWIPQAGILTHDSYTSQTWIEHQAYVGQGSDWTDYQIIVEVDANSAKAGIILRCQEDLQSYLLLVGTTSSLQLKTYIDGDVFDETDEIEPGFFTGYQDVRVVADGATIRVYINDNLRLTVEGVPLLSGMPGLYAYGRHATGSNAAHFDNFRVTALD